MSDLYEKKEEKKKPLYDDSGSETSSARGEIFERPKGIRGLYSHPLTQIVMLGFVWFMCPGLFNAVNGLGAGGQLDSTNTANSNSALYSTFAAAAFFAGSINNTLGSRVTLLLGSTGYSLYIGSFLYVHPIYVIRGCDLIF
jgi:hypothetical protein